MYGEGAPSDSSWTTIVIRIINSEQVCENLFLIIGGRMAQRVKGLGESR